VITYRRVAMPTLAQARALYRACSLGARRPIDDDARFGAMLQQSNLVVTAWDGTDLYLAGFNNANAAGTVAICKVSGAITSPTCGIGRELVRHTRAAAPQASLILLAAPAAVDYYPRIGFERHDSAWLLRSDAPLR